MHARLFFQLDCCSRVLFLLFTSNYSAWIKIWRCPIRPLSHPLRFWNCQYISCVCVCKLLPDRLVIQPKSNGDWIPSSSLFILDLCSSFITRKEIAWQVASLLLMRPAAIVNGTYFWSMHGWGKKKVAWRKMSNWWNVGLDRWNSRSQTSGYECDFCRLIRFEVVALHCHGTLWCIYLFFSLVSSCFFASFGKTISFFLRLISGFVSCLADELQTKIGRA